MLAGIISCKHNPVDPHQPDTTQHHCDTCDTTHKHCDTCSHDTSHHQLPGPGDTTSHAFIWSQSTIQNEAGLDGCWVFGPNNVYVVGGTPHKFNGASWTTVHLVDADRGFSLDGLLSGCSMFAFSENDYWLTYGFPGHVTGSTLKEYRFGSDTVGFLHSSWGTSSSNMYSVGDGGTILHFDGTSWTKMQSGTTKELSSIWGTSTTDIWATGYNPTTAESALVHFDGSSWTSIDPHTLNPSIGIGGHSLDCIWSCDSAGHHFTIVSGTLAFRNTDGNRWRSDSGLIPNKLSDHSFIGLASLRGNTANDIFAAGDGGLIVHWNGRSWYRYESLYDPNNTFYITNALAVNQNVSCAVGGKNGQAWIAIGQRK
jgi:hypothetical protein